MQNKFIFQQDSKTYFTVFTLLLQLNLNIRLENKQQIEYEKLD